MIVAISPFRTWMRPTVALCLVLCLQVAQALFLDLRPGQRRCIGEELGENTLAKLAFGVRPLASAGQQEAAKKDGKGRKQKGVIVEVVSPSLKRLHKRELQAEKDGDEQSYQFQSIKAGLYKVCFQNPLKSPGQRVEYVSEIRFDTTSDFASEIKNEEFHPLEQVIRSTGAAAGAINREMDFMALREAHQHEQAELTAWRINMFSTFSVIVLLAVTGWQIWYLKGFFRAKKLL